MAIEIYSTPEILARAAAARIRSVAAEALEWRGQFRIAVSGGRTPAYLFGLLAADAAIDWCRAQVGFADERAVPPGHASSNFRLVEEHLIAPLGERAPAVHRMRGEAADLREAAADAEAWYAEPVDLLLLGMGADGHVASIFPHSPVLGERVHRVAAVYDAPAPSARRLTVTPRVIVEARKVLVLVTGGDKAPAVAAAQAEEGLAAQCPARLVRTGEWMVDRAAATAMK